MPYLARTSGASLKGYRIGLPSEFDTTSGESRRKWNRIEAVELVLKLRFEGAPESHDEFKIWWRDQVQRAREENLSLIVVSDEDDRYNKWQTMLKRIEEEEWDRGGKISVTFTTLDSLLDTLSTGSLPVDTWGDSIARGENDSIFHGDLFAIEHFDAGLVPRSENDVVIDSTDHSSDPIEQVIRRNGGMIANQGDINPLPKICYVVTNGVRDQVMNAIISNPLLATLSKAGVTMIPVNVIWVWACAESGIKCNPELHPLLFQPQTWNVQHAVGLHVSVSRTFHKPIRFAVRWWLEAMGAILKGEPKRLICEKSGCNRFKSANKKGIPIVSLEWVYHTMQNGYENGSEERFPYKLAINIGEVGGTAITYRVTITAELSAAFHNYATRVDTSLSQLEFRFNGRVINKHDATPRMVGLQNDDKINVNRVDT